VKPGSEFLFIPLINICGIQKVVVIGLRIIGDFFLG